MSTASCVPSLAATVTRAAGASRDVSARRVVADGRAFLGAGRRDGAVTSRRDCVDVTASSSLDARAGEREGVLRARFARGAVAATAALALALAPDARADDADAVPAATVAVDASDVVADDASDASSLEVVEIPFDDVPVGDAPDIEARVKYTADLQKRGITELEAKAIENNQKIKQYNNAPEEFPTFVREGYEVRVLTTDGFVTQDDGLVFKDFVTGEGDLPRDGQEVTFQYVAYNESGGTIDSTYRKGVPASTRLGINGMIPGFEEGLKGMRPGGKRRVVVPPELGPPTGPATFFSAKQWEVFDIELLEVKNCARVQSSFMSSSVVCE
jgi:FKBP-type peptidyl-prolyl cis-trans isomerase